MNLRNLLYVIKESVEKLQEENAFLADTIEKHNLGQIKMERRSLLIENEQCKRDASIAIQKAQQIKDEYEFKMTDADNRLADVKRKQSDVNLYIEEEAENKVKGIKAEYENYKKSNDKALEKHKEENNKKIKEKELFFREKNKKYFIITAISVVFCIAGIIFDFR